MPNRHISRLSLKIILVLTAITVVIVSIYAVFATNRLKEDLTEACIQNAYNMSDIVKRSSRYAMLHNRREDLTEIINTVGSEKGVYKLRIYNKDGFVAYSSDTTEIGKYFHIESPSCAPCHSKPELPSNLEPVEMSRQFWNDKGVKVLGLINPIDNELDCYNSDCHYHKAEDKLLGVLDIIIFTDKIDKVINTNSRNIAYGTLLIALVLSGFIILYINLVVNRPLRKISNGISALGMGNLNYKIDLKSHDELGRIGNQFNEMTNKLNMAYTEIKEWNENLNQKVEEKNEELKKIYEQVVQIEKLASLGKLSATVAHELNNPLEGVLTYSKLIAKKLSKENPDGKFNNLIKYLNLISDETTRCGRIVKDLLLFSHKGEGEFIDTDVTSIMEKSLMLIKHHFEIHKIKVVKDYPDVPMIVYSDPQKLEQSFISILINGIESMRDEGTITVQISNEEDQCTIRISDQGKGIGSEDLPYIFEPFYTTKSNQKGTGLGLAVVFGIIQLHKGRISVESTSELGTVFKIELPLKKQ